MSTKIYDAYRIPKSEFENEFIMNILKKLKDETYDFFIHNEDILKGIHILTMVWLKAVKEDEERFEKFVNGEDFTINTISNYLQECERQTQKSLYYFNIDFNCSVFEDKDYWYVKFFRNQRWQWDLLNEWEEKYEWLEDYHYQNSTDPPENISYEEFKKRDDKWDELTGDVDSYVNGLQYTFMDAHQFYMLVSRSRWDDNLELAYDFKQNPKKIENNES